jgi:HSP20 family protein
MMLARRQPTLTPTRSLTNFGDFGSVFSDFDRLWNEVTSSYFSPGEALSHYPVDLYETGDCLVLEMAVPGISGNDLDISIEGRQLTIRGRYPVTADEERRYWVQTIPHGEFSRTLSLPVAVEAEQIQARVQEGLLILTMPKVAEARAKRIAIQAG